MTRFHKVSSPSLNFTTKPISGRLRTMITCADYYVPEPHNHEEELYLILTYSLPRRTNHFSQVLTKIFCLLDLKYATVPHLYERIVAANFIR